MEKKKILLLLDYRGSFYSSTREVTGSMNVQKIKSLFEKMGYEINVEGFPDVDFRSGNYSKSFVLYQSSEDPDLRYKDYIEDILLGLEIKGAILIPDFCKFRAHHNKVFMEVLRDVSGFEPIQNLQSTKYGTLSEFEHSINAAKFPAVIKAGACSRSLGVGLAQNKKEAVRFSRKVAKSFSFINLQRFIGSIFSRKGFKYISDYRRKFILQNFVSGLTCDYKVLVYAEKFYILERKNRVNDFRASGSGLVSFPVDPPRGLLDYAEKVFAHFNTPFISMDIAIRDNEFFLPEFQFLSFGQYALEKSFFFFKKEASRWVKADSYSDLEETFTHAVNVYIEKLTFAKRGNEC